MCVYIYICTYIYTYICIYIHTCTHNRILFSLKKEENLAIFDNIDEPGKTLLSEISQTEKDKYCMYHLRADS